eukprot:2214606-Prymnesium_polylepis.1
MGGGTGGGDGGGGDSGGEGGGDGGPLMQLLTSTQVKPPPHLLLGAKRVPDEPVAYVGSTHHGYASDCT